MKIAESSRYSQLPENARVAEFLPYDALFEKVDVFVTNGGYGGVHYALAHGVPMVVAGMTEDKAEVSARIVWTGTGVSLRTNTPTAEKVAAAAPNRARSGLAPANNVDRPVVVENVSGRRSVSEPPTRISARSKRT